jgi:thiosulfate dehydrogenase [quinone] large subunit
MWQVKGADGSVAPGWYLLPLRLFLGVTFLYAGLQKLANPDFLKSASPISIHSQMLGASRTSPIGPLLGHLLGAAPAIGLVIALGEVAVGIGTLLGLLTRVAAGGGMVLSFSLFLAISFHTSPYFTGADIVFFFAWMPMVLAGAGGAPALDTWLSRQRAAVPGGDPDALSRREVVSKGALVGLVAISAALIAGMVAGVGRVFAHVSSTETTPTLAGGGGTTTTTTTTTTTSGSTGTTVTTVPATGAPKGSTSIGPASGVPVGGSAAFTDPKTGDPSLVIQRVADEFVAFDAVCPHAGCTVAYQAGANIIACPCHGSEFNPETGAVVQGPATYGLTRIHIIEGSNGDLYVI